jgi:hypothetical protein
MIRSKIARSAKLVLAVTVALLGPGLIAAKADPVVDVSGTFDNGGGTFTGSFQVSGGTTPATGEVIDANTGTITVTGGPAAGTYTDTYEGQDDGTLLYIFQDSSSGTPSSYPYIDLYFTGSDPLSEASMCTDASSSTSCPYGTSQLRVNSDVYDGVEAAAATPEPGSLSLLAFGLVGLGLLYSKRRLIFN